MIKEGQIIKIIAGFFDVKAAENKIYRLRASGYLRDENIIPIVGDFVKFKNDSLIFEIKPRKNYLIRPKVANIDQVIIITALDQPKFSSFLLDSFLMMVEAQNIPIIIIFTKMDLTSDYQAYSDYVSQGYNCFLIDNLKQNNELERIKKLLKNKLNVFMGQSGVGKTSLLNNLFNLNEKTSAISKVLNRGKHTTRVVEIFEINNMRIVDTPGFSSFKINLTKEEAAKAFHDFKKWARKCKFNSCLHDKEIECQVKEKIKEHKLLESRYKNYIKILNELG